jgi:dTDP-4-dehydrorhamnose 3,5-epimerase
MELTPLAIEGAWVAKSPIFNDERGSFREWFKREEIRSKTGFNFDVAQANISTSSQGVVRGIHYSLAKKGQAKWITCVNGAIKDVVVDVRPASATYGKFLVIDLHANSGEAILIDSQLGHGFVSGQQDTTIVYLLSSPYSPAEEFGIHPLDPVLGIDWGLPTKELLISPKDKSAPTLNERALQGKLP